jgi:hypothetical protein
MERLHAYSVDCVQLRVNSWHTDPGRAVRQLLWCICAGQCMCEHDSIGAQALSVNSLFLRVVVRVQHKQ